MALSKSGVSGSEIVDISGKPIEVRPPCVYIYDTRGLQMVDYHSLPPDTTPLVIKSMFVNTVDEHIKIYAQDLRKIGSLLMDNLRDSFITRAVQRAEDVFRSIEVTSDDDLSILLPYAEIAYDESGVVTAEGTIPFVNGMFVVARLK